MWDMLTVIVDDKYRIVIPSEIRKIVGISKGDRVLVLPFAGGILLLNLKDKRFEGSLRGFKFVEEMHEASRALFKEVKSNAGS